MYVCVCSFYAYHKNTIPLILKALLKSKLGGESGVGVRTRCPLRDVGEAGGGRCRGFERKVRVAMRCPHLQAPRGSDPKIMPGGSFSEGRRIIFIL